MLFRDAVSRWSGKLLRLTGPSLKYIRVAWAHSIQSNASMLLPWQYPAIRHFRDECVVWLLLFLNRVAGSLSPGREGWNHEQSQTTTEDSASRVSDNSHSPQEPSP